MNSETISILLLCVAAVTLPVLSIKFAVKRPVLTLIGAFLGSILYAVIGGFVFDEYGFECLIKFMLLILSVLWFPSLLLVLSFTPILQPHGEIPWWKILARTILGIIFGILLLAGLLAAFNILGLLFFIFFAVAILRYRKAARCNRALEIVSTLAAAMRQNLPLPTALQTAAIGRTDKTAWVFRRIAYWLTQGYSLAESVRKGYPRCLPQLLMAIETSEKINQLPQTLLSLEKDLVNDSDETKKVRPVHPWYPVLVLIVVAFLTTGLLIFIIPTFAGVLSDMSDGHTALPAATQFTLNASKAMSSPKNLLCLACIMVTAVGYGWYYHFRTRISCKPGPFLNLVDRIRWFGPIQSKLERNLSTLQLVEILRPALSAGLSIPQAITATLGTKMNICFKNRVNRWLKCVEGGANVAQSARACGIGHSVAWALDDRINPGQAPILLEMLEENCRNKHNYLGNIIRSVMWPIVIVAMGAFVGFIVYAMFIPMVHIITICIESINP